MPLSSILFHFVCFGYFVVDSGIQNFPKHADAGLRGYIRQYAVGGQISVRVFPFPTAYSRITDGHATNAETVKALSLGRGFG
jgi:hypothetical protein